MKPQRVSCIIVLFASLSFSATAALPGPWQVKSSPTSNHLTGIAYGNGLFVAVGRQGTLLTSSTGIDWMPRPMGSTIHPLLCVTHGGGRYVAGGGESLLIRSSTDGINWNDGLSTIGVQHIYGITYGYGQFVGVGDGEHIGTSYILTSSNGLEWISRNVPTTNRLLGISAALGPASSLYVAVGERGTIITSPDGVNWTLRNSGTQVALRAVAFHQSRFFAGGDSSVVLRSSDGINWSVGAPPSFGVRGLAAGNGVVVAVGSYNGDGRAHVSSDGLGWPGDATLCARPLNGIAYGPGAFVAVGDGGLIVQSQGVTAGATNEWTKATSGYWEENYWSLGQLPSIEQAAVAFRNPGFKALAIGANTTANYRDSLSIRNLLVYDPANLLLLNWAGLEVPLSISSDFTLGPGASLLSYYSALNVGTFNSGGRATFSEGSRASFGTVHLGVNGRAELTISNAIITSGGLTIGNGTANQFAGTNQVTGPDGIYVTDGSTYNLSNGTLIARSAQIASGGAQFNMANGSVQIEGRILLANGNFLLQGGVVQAGEINPQTGRFTQSAGSNVVASLGVAYASQFQGAEYLLSGGTLASGDVSVGNGFMVTGTFEQSGGIHNNSGEIQLWGYERTAQHHTAGFYRLGAGILSANRINVLGGSFTQSGGTNRVGDIVLDFAGSFSLTGGSLSSSNCMFTGQTGSLPYYSPAVFVQSNGTHTVQNQMLIEKTTSPFSSPRGGIYRLDAGTLISQIVDVRDQFAQTGGAHTNRQYISVGGSYTLSGGYLVSPALNIYSGYFTQTGGTNHADGVGMLGKSTFYLGGGTLSTVNLRVGSSDVSGRDGRSWFVHSNGNHFVSNTLAIDPGFYRLDAGNLGASNIVIYPDSELWINGGSINNPGTLTMYDGKVLAQGAHQLGKLVVATGPLPFFTDSDPFSTLDLQNGSAVIRFQDSRDRASEWNGRLIIRNWSGATNGGGTDRVYVGTTAQGLTAAQLGTIIFESPAGLPIDSYPARILSTGEIVPAARPAMMFSRSANRLVISWSGDYWLLTATNVAGPFTPIIGATSPYTNLFTGPQRYFQLRSSGYWP